MCLQNWHIVSIFINVQSNSITTDFFVPWYQKLNWIQSTWTQRINTWINVSSDITYWFECWISEVTSTWTHSIMDMWWTWTDNYRYWIQYGSNAFQFWHSWWQWWWWTTVSWYWPNWWWTETHVLKYNPNWWKTWVIDWTTVVTNMSMSNRSYSSNWNIFCQVYWTTFTRYWMFKLHYMKIYHWSTLVRDFVPAKRKSDSVVWLIDLVNKVFYTNAWSWTFNYW